MNVLLCRSFWLAHPLPPRPIDDDTAAAEAPRIWGVLKAVCREALEEERGVGHGPWYLRGEEPWPGVVTGVMARFLRRAPGQLAAAEVNG